MRKKDLETWQKVMVAFVGMCVMIIGISKLASTSSRRDWRTTQGKIIFLSIREHSITNIWSRYASFDTEVIFEYQVGSKQYVSDNVPLSTKSFKDRDSAEKYLRNFEIGETIPVYYNPHKPHMAAYVIEEKKDTLLNLGIVIFGSIMLAYGVFLILITKT